MYRDLLSLPRRLLSSCTRSWIICSLNYPQLSLGAMLLAAALIAAGFSSSAAAGMLLLVLGGALGSAVASRDFGFFVRRAMHLLDSREGVPAEIDDKRKGTGLEILDQFINHHATRVRHLHEALESLGEETEELEEQYNLLEDQYKLLTENLAAAIVVRDVEGQILYCSPYTEVLTGSPLSDIYGHEGDFFLSRVNDEDKENYRRALKVSAYGEAFKFQYRFSHSSGIEMWLETRTVPVLGEEGEVISSLSITLDVSTSVRHQKLIEEKNRDLQDFTYMVSHDLKAPIFTIKGMANILKEEYSGKLEEEPAEMLSHVWKAATRLEQLVASVLEYSRISSQKMESGPVDLKGVIEDVLNDYLQQIESQKAEVLVPDQLPTVLGDRLRVYQIFSNLVGNAIKYRHPARPPRIEIAVLADNERYAEISIKDNGEGIPPDKHEEVFRPFQRLHGTNIEGSGIGLACVKKLLELSGGNIHLESEKGVGSNFTLTLRKR